MCVLAEGQLGCWKRAHVRVCVCVCLRRAQARRRGARRTARTFRQENRSPAVVLADVGDVAGAREEVVAILVERHLCVCVLCVCVHVRVCFLVCVP